MVPPKVLGLVISQAEIIADVPAVLVEDGGVEKCAVGELGILAVGDEAG
jgi:hypothetical protein